MELSPDLISACLALEKYLDNPKALTERELVRGALGLGGSSFHCTLASPGPQGLPVPASGGVCLSPGP